MLNDSIIIEPLKRTHTRNVFDCGEIELNNFLRQHAMQNQESGFTRTFVAVERIKPTKIVGYYSLTASSINKNNLPEKATKRFPNYPTPIIRVARLGVDVNNQKQGLGEFLLMDALYRSLEVWRSVGCIAVVVDAKHETARKFYSKYEFESLPNQPLMLWLPMLTLQKLFRKTPVSSTNLPESLLIE